MFGSVAACALFAVLSQVGTIADRPAAGAAPVVLHSVLHADAANPVRLTVPASSPSRPGQRAALVGLYASFVTLDALDVHSTLRAIGNGAVEVNPAMRGVVNNKASFIAMKAATGSVVIFVSEKLRKEHPGLAIVMMAGINSAMAAVVAHNYSIR